MEKQILVLTEKIEGGEWIATKRLIKMLKRKHPFITCHYLILDKRSNSQKRFSFVINLVDRFLKTRLTIKNSIAKEDFDYIFVSDYLWALAAISVKLRKTKLILLFHGLRSIPFRRFSDIDYRQISIKILERLSWILSDAMTVPSKEAFDYIRKSTMSLVAKQKIFLVPNIVPSVFFQTKIRKHISRKYGVLYSGRMGSRKGLENLIVGFSNAASNIPNIDLIIAYPTSSMDSKVESLVKRLVKENNLENKIKFIKDSTENELINLYRSSDVLILPSELEFAPLSVLESLASGTPVIATNVGNIGSLLMKLDPTLILKNNSQEEIASKLIMLYKFGKEKRTTLRRKAIGLASNFSEQKVYGNFKKLLNFLV